MAPAAFQATFSDWRLIKGRKCVSICFEVPLEAANEAYAVLGGMPDPGRSVWCAIARLQEPKSKPEKPQSEKKRWEDMTAAQQAGVLCGDAAFVKFLDGRYANITIRDSGSAAVAVRDICGVLSRSEIDSQPTAKARWDLLVAEYRAWQREPEYV
jgi:hypothetical protein